MSLDLQVTPTAVMLDAAVGVTVSGLRPGAQARLTATTRRATGASWASQATFRADAQGSIDLARDASLAGTWQGVEPMGWSWSMQRATADGAAADPFARPAPEAVELVVDSGGAAIRRTLVRHFVPADASFEVVREAGVQGVLVRPAGPVASAVIVLNGGDGGLDPVTAGLLAAHGHAGFALGYFGLPGLPRDLVEIPLESLAAGIAWLRAQPGIPADRIAVAGRSKGGELALLLGATFPSVRAVVAVVPSAITHGWLSGDPPVIRPCWTYGGAPLPFTPIDRTRNRFVAGEPYSIRPGYEATLDDPARVAATTIAVERTCGPILLISGGADACWPSTPLAEIAVRRLREHDFAHEVTHLAYPAAGHKIGLPNLPSGQDPDAFFADGGSAAANAAASRASWREFLGFLERVFEP